MKAFYSILTPWPWIYKHLSLKLFFVSLSCYNRYMRQGQHSHTFSNHTSANLWEQWLPCSPQRPSASEVQPAYGVPAQEENCKLHTNIKAQLWYDGDPVWALSLWVQCCFTLLVTKINTTCVNWKCPRFVPGLPAKEPGLADYWGGETSLLPSLVHVSACSASFSPSFPAFNWRKWEKKNSCESCVGQKLECAACTFL